MDLFLRRGIWVVGLEQLWMRRHVCTYALMPGLERCTAGKCVLRCVHASVEPWDPGRALAALALPVVKFRHQNGKRCRQVGRQAGRELGVEQVGR